MASEGRWKAGTTRVATMIVRSLLILWICSGLCVCVDEVPGLPFDPDAKDAADVPARDQPSAADRQQVDQPPYLEGSLPSLNQEVAEPHQQDQDGAPEGQSEAAEDQGETVDSQSQAVDGQSQDVDGQSQAVDDQSQDVDGQSQAVDGQSQAVDGQSQAVDGQSQAVDGQSETAEAQSEAPQEEDEGAFTEMPPVETEASPVSTKEPVEPVTEQPQDELGDFMVPNDEGVVCLRACFAALLKVDYLGQDEDGKAVNRTAEVPIPKTADVSGYCNQGADEQSALELQWDEYSLKITFQKQNSSIKGDPNFWEARSIQFTFDTRDSNYFDGAFDAGERSVRTKPGATFFATPQGDSRICKAEDDVIMKSTSNNTEKVTMEMSQLQLQPYGVQNGTFSEGVDCSEDLIENPNTNVASIAVGATLACLILVVIIVYAVGHKMGAINDRSGYKSVE